MSFNRLKYLMEACLRRTASDEELEELEYLCQLPENKEMVRELINQALDEPKLLTDMPVSSSDRIRQHILSGEQGPAISHSGRWRSVVMRVAIAAIFIIVAGVSVFFFIQENNSEEITPGYAIAATSNANNKITPGTNKATLTLDDGTVIVLDSAENGLLKKTDGIKVIKLADGQLTYASTEVPPATEMKYNTVVTPRGGQYIVELADGTKAWLNAASSIRFPSIFNDKERTVEISGEVYFEVARTPNNIPFKVNCNDVQINVLGTHFNVMAYPEENNIQTTLFEGSVAINKKGNQTLLKPGEQMNIFSGKMHAVQKINDLESVIAWKNGRFELNGSIQGIMRQIARWYDVDVKYEGNVTDKQFGGAISRYEDVQEVLKLLQLTENIKFTVRDRTIIVSP